MMHERHLFHRRPQVIQYCLQPHCMAYQLKFPPLPLPTNAPVFCAALSRTICLRLCCADPVIQPVQLRARRTDQVQEPLGAQRGMVQVAILGPDIDSATAEQATVMFSKQALAITTFGLNDKQQPMSQAPASVAQAASSTPLQVIFDQNPSALGSMIISCMSYVGLIERAHALCLTHSPCEIALVSFPTMKKCSACLEQTSAGI